MPASYHEKIDCWSSLQNLQESLDLKDLIIAGDLNTTLNHKEKKGGSRLRDPTREHLEDLISSFHLLDIKPSNGCFTWSNRWLESGHITAHLDWFLLRSSFLDDSFTLAFSPGLVLTTDLSLSPFPLLTTLAPSPSNSTPCGL